MDNLLADRAEQQARETSAAAIADDDEGRVAGLIEENLGRLSFQRPSPSQASEGCRRSTSATASRTTASAFSRKPSSVDWSNAGANPPA